MPRKIVFQDEKVQNIFDNLLSQIDSISAATTKKVSAHRRGTMPPHDASADS